MTARGIIRGAAVAAMTAAILLAVAGCSDSSGPASTLSTSDTAAAFAPESRPPASLPAQRPPAPEPAQPALAADPARLADELVADELTLRDPSSAEAALAAAARRQQVAYRAIGRHPEWDAIIRPRIPASLLENYDRNVDARRNLSAMHVNWPSTLPAWRINPPAPAGELLDYYRLAESATGVGWNYLAAINLVETAFGRIAGVSTAGAQGPMQFMPATFAAYGDGGDILSPRDSIMAAGRYLAANDFATRPGHALYRYNNSQLYVAAIEDYATVIATEPSAFAAYHRWDVYYRTTAGDVVLPIGYAAQSPVPVAEYLAEHPQ
ncbi:MAG: transglycosylase SLT domain-containing protein [Mycolicibacterium sp.]|uniref:lytic transglycosylase domain-containing protein n=1 Tax=Mycolicibacterium sp. TaxID=2320850 RepID=UPI003D143D0F